MYLLPIVIYRYVIRKKPLKPGSALPVTLLYGTVALLVVAILGYTTGLSALVAVAVLLCSVLVYLMLHSGRQAAVAEVQAQAFPNGGTLHSQQVPPVAPLMPNTPPVAPPPVSSMPSVQPAPTMQSSVVPPAPPVVMQGMQPAAMSEVPVPPVTSPTQQTQPQRPAAPQVVCRNCGRMLQPGDVYCGYCGTKATQDTELQNY